MKEKQLEDLLVLSHFVDNSSSIEGVIMGGGRHLEGFTMGCWHIASEEASVFVGKCWLHIIVHSIFGYTWTLPLKILLNAMKCKSALWTQC